MSEAWSQWQGQVIDGKFHLKQYLGGSGESAVFLAHLHSGDARVRCEDSEPVAIRLIADSANPELQLSRWRMAEDIAHPHLLRIIDTGRCRLGVIDLIYAVMEYAEENLGQILPERPLTVAEALDMLGPALEALSYLHGRGLVHGHIKPAAIMAMNNELKMAVDGVRPAEQPLTLETSRSSNSSASPASVSGIYDAPETANGVWMPAADVWSLGVTLAEVLTQQLPSTDGLNDSEADPLLPGNLPFELVEIVRGCLRRNLELRWSIPVIRQRLETRAPDQAAAAATVRQPSAPSMAPMSQRDPAFESSQPDLHDQETDEAPVPAAALAHAATDSAACAGPTFSQALRAKPVVSERPVIAQQELARAASASVQGATVIVPSEPQPYHLPISLTPKRAQPAEAARVSREIAPAREISGSGINANGSRDLLRTTEDEMDRRAALALLVDGEEDKSASVAAVDALKKAMAIAMTAGSSAKTVLATATARTMPVLRQTATRSVSRARQITLETRNRASQLAAFSRSAASQIQEILGPYPAKKVQSLGMAAVAVIAIGIAIYVSLGLLRHNSPGQAAHAKKTPPPKVIIIKQTPKAAPARRPAAQPAPTQSAPAQPAAQKSNKPSPRQASAQTSPSTAAPSSPGTLAQVASTQAPAGTQPVAPQSSAQAEAQSSVRRIDDGGADDDEPNAKAAPVNRSIKRAAAGSTAVDQSVGIAQQVMPQVSTSALRTIHGTVRVSVRVKVDSSGKVARAELANAGPSRYFARKSLEAAQNWKFASGAGSPFLVHFEYRNNGARAFATRTGS